MSGHRKSDERDNSPKPKKSAGDAPEEGEASGEPKRGGFPVFLIFWLLCALMMFAPAMPWHGWRGGLLVVAGLLMVAVPPRFHIRRSWIILAALFLGFSALALLPADWFPVPAWRGPLTAAGATLSDSVSPHFRQTLEAVAASAFAVFVALYLTGHRTDHRGNQILATLFAVTVALLALFALGAMELKWVIPWDKEATYGFFLNRNHMATLLVMGTAAGLAVGVQSLRFKTWGTGIPALGAVLICGWTTIGYSISRAGVVLLVALFATWMLILGKKYVRGKVLVAVAVLAVAGIYHFATRNSEVKQRIDEIVEKAGEYAGVGTGEEEPSTLRPVVTLQSLDLRVPIFEDTVKMIGDAPWTGFGAGQFPYVFPQYRLESAVVNDARSVHPESDWLQTAAESGIPAALSLAALVILIGGTALRSAVTGRAKALRTGCLLGAAVVPIHGLVDVPGHRMELVWPACLLLAISLRTSGFGPASGLSRLCFRGLGVLVIAAGIYLIDVQWFGGMPPATVIPARTVEEVSTLYKEEMEAQKVSEKAGDANFTNGERYQKCLALLDEALKTAPMDSQLQGLRGSIATQMVGRETEADRSFAIQRMLDPTWIAVPFIQASGWASFDPERTGDLWLEGMKRVGALEKIHPVSAAERKVAVARMMRDCLVFTNLIPYALWAADGYEPLFVEWTTRIGKQPLDRITPLLMVAEISDETRRTLFENWLARGTKLTAEKFAREKYPELLPAPQEPPPVPPVPAPAPVPPPGGP